MFTTQPMIQERAEQPYLGIRTQVTLAEMGTDVIPRLHSEVLAWMNKQGMEPTGAPFIRFYIINMEARLDIELGWLVANAAPGEGRIQAGVLPAGRYASLIYTGISNGIEGNKVLLEWGTQQELVWDAWEVENGHAFRSRFESFLTNPADEADQTKWETEVAIRLADA